MQDRRDTSEIRGGVGDKPRKENLFQTPNFFLDVHVLGPGQVAKVHTHAAEDKCYVVLSGHPTVVRGEEEAVCGPGEAVLCPAGVPHGVRNEHPREDVRLLVYMAPHPRPDEATS